MKNIFERTGTQVNATYGCSASRYRRDKAKAGFKNGILLEVRLEKDINLQKITYKDKTTLVFSSFLSDDF